jgi:hypothetical protein
MVTNMQAIRSRLGAQVTYVYASAPYTGGVWIRDPPGGKGRRLSTGRRLTTPPNWADNSFNYLDNLVATQGPFDGLVGYSQGGAMTVLYLSHAPANTFRFAVVFCGYLTTTHAGLLGRVNAATAAQFSIRTLFYMSNNDAVITPALTQAAAARFSNTVIVVDNGGGHNPPTSGQPLTSVVNFIQGYIGAAANPPPPAGAASPPPVAVASPPPVGNAAPPPPIAVGGSWSGNRQLPFGGQTRTYRLYTPTQNPPVGLAVLLHGSTMTSQDMVGQAAPQNAAAANGFMFAVPQGLNNGWNDEDPVGNGLADDVSRIG